jgi:hypothetical protein
MSLEGRESSVHWQRHPAVPANTPAVSSPDADDFAHGPLSAGVNAFTNVFVCEFSSHPRSNLN